MFSPPTIPHQCEVIFRQDLRPSDTIIPLQSQQLLITLADNTPSELHPIVVMPQFHGQETSPHTETTAPPVHQPAEPTNLFLTERTPTLEAMVRRACSFDYSNGPGGKGMDVTQAKKQARLSTMKTPEPEPEPEPKPKIQARGDRVRRSRRQQTPVK